MSQELNLNELEAAARAYPANITRTVCALLDHIRALEAGKVPEGYRLVRAELRDEMIRMAAPRRCKIGSACTDCTCAGSDSEANAPGMVADSAGGADKRDARDAERLDWLLWKLPGDAIRHCVGELSDTADRAEFRAAIDAMIWRTGSPDALRPTASPDDKLEDARREALDDAIASWLEVESCCNTPSYCSSVMRCTAKDAAPAPSASPTDAEEDAYVIDWLGKLLAGVAIALKGPDLAQHRHSYHDLVEVAEKMVLELDLYRAAYGNKIPAEASASPAALTDAQRHSGFSCANRAADPQNEFAACRQWCGDSQRCVNGFDTAKFFRHVDKILSMDMVQREQSTFGASEATPELLAAIRAVNEIEEKTRRALLAASPADQGEDATAAARDVLAERHRQVIVHGFAPYHDDEHDGSELAIAASCYAIYSPSLYAPGNPPPEWPWAPEWWKPKDDRRNFVRAAALLLAEIERIDRAAMSASKEGA